MPRSSAPATLSCRNSSSGRPRTRGKSRYSGFVRAFLHFLPVASFLSFVAVGAACVGSDPAPATTTPEVDGGASGNVVIPSNDSGADSGGLCPAGFDDCNGSAVDGCESRLAADANNCGKCGNVCGTANTLSKACTGGGCQFTCVDNYASCGPDAAGCNTKIDDDPKNCGACGRDCGPGATCSKKQCSVVSLYPNPTVSSYPTTLAVDATNLWYATADSKIWRMFKDGQNPFNPVSNLVSYPRALVTDGKRVVWANYNDDDPKEVVTMTYDSGSAMNVKPVSEAAFVTLHGFLALAGNTVVWSSRDNEEDAVKRVDFDGQNPRVVAEGDGRGAGLATDATDVYWSDRDHIYKQALSATEPCKVGATVTCTLVATAPSYVLALDEKFVYFTDSASVGAIKKVAKSGGAVTTLATNQASPVSIATDGKYVYWGNREIGPAQKSVRRIKVDAASPCASDDCELVSILAVAEPSAIVLDDKFVYWIDANSQSPFGGTFKRAK